MRLSNSGQIPPIPDFDAVAHQSPESAEKIWNLVNKGWEPGKEGKGMVVNHQLYHWNTQDEDGWPHHHNVADVMNTAGLPVLHPTNGRELHPDTHLLYYIDPDGNFDTSSEDADKIVQAQDPRLNLDEYAYKFASWKFGDDAGGVDSGGTAGGNPAPADPSPAPSDSPTPATVVYGYPFMGMWGHAMSHWQNKHRSRKHRKKSDYWDDQKAKDFPEDFRPTDPGPMPDNMDPRTIKDLVRKGYEPGNHGKALIDANGRRFDWNVNEYGQPHHHEVEQALGVVPDGAKGQVLIDPEGRELNWDDLLNEDLDKDENHELGLGGNWVFGHYEDETPHRLNWEEGNEGKGILTKGGELHTWNGDDYDYHFDYIADHPDVDDVLSHHLYISPHGKVTTVWGTLEPKHEEQLREADPRLYLDLDTGNGTPWAFGA